MIHRVQGFGIVNKIEVDIFMELSGFFDDPADADYLISVPSAFSKSSLKMWKFTVHALLKPGLENFEHYFTSWEIDGETVEMVSDFIFLSSKITADGDCSHEIKRHLLSSLEGKL